MGSRRALGVLALASSLLVGWAAGALADPRSASTVPSRAKPPARAPRKVVADAGAQAAPEPAAGAPSPATPAGPTAVPEGSGPGPGDAGVVEARTLDGGARAFKFSELDIEGRLKSPQLVYFLRRVRAEFAAGDLGHRSFMREMYETRKEPSF